jgi:hypothetical protein
MQPKKSFTILIEKMDETGVSEGRRRKLITGPRFNGGCLNISVHDSRCFRLSETVGEVETRGGFTNARSAFGVANMMAMEGFGRKRLSFRVSTAICRKCLPGA